MPVLEHLKRVFQDEFGDDFSKLPNRDNTLFVIVQHGFASIRPMMETFLELGIASDQIFMTTKPHTTPPEMLKYFRAFEHYIPFQWLPSPADLQKTDIKEAAKSSHYKTLTAITHKKLFDKFCDYLLRYQEGSNRKIENIVICDEGGKFLSQFIESYHKPDPHARRNLKDYHIVAIEHTKCGTYRPELRNLPFPLINMADSYIKTNVEAQYIAESMFVYLDKVLQSIRNFSSMTIGVVGGGNIGKEVLVFLSKQYTNTSVIVFDLDHSMMASTEIRQHGWKNVTRVASAEVIFQQATVILGCTGKNFMKSVSQDCFSENPENHIHLISCSSGDSEFQVWLERMPDYKFESLKDIRDYKLTLSAGKQVTLYNGGFPMNFYVQQSAGIPAEETVPLDKVQITRSMKLAAIVQALKLLEVTPFISKKDDVSLKDYMKLDVIYQWEIIQAFYKSLMQDNPHNQNDIENKSIGINQPNMNSAFNIPYYITTRYQSTMRIKLARQPFPIKRLTIRGTAGSGKTTLALHCLQKQKIQYPEILSRTILAESKEQWWYDLRDWAEELFPDLNSLLKQQLDSREQRKLISDHLKRALSEKKWCVLIDNWDQSNWDQNPPFIRILQNTFSVGHGILLLTTQGDTSFSDPDQDMDLSFGLSPDESKNLLINVMNTEKTLQTSWQMLGDAETLNLLIRFLNHLPLAVVVAGSYLLWENKSRRNLGEQVPFTYTDYRKLLELHVTELIRIHEKKLSDKADIPNEDREEFMRVKTQEAAVDLSIEKAIHTTSSSTESQKILWFVLCFCGFLASDHIPQQLLKGYLNKLEFYNSNTDIELYFYQLLQLAKNYSLLQEENTRSIVDNEPNLHMHRVIQRVLQDNYWPKLLKAISIKLSQNATSEGRDTERTSVQKVKDLIFFSVMQEALYRPWETAVNEKKSSIIRAYLPHIKEWMLYFLKVTQEIEKPDIETNLLNLLQYSLATAYYILGDYHQTKQLSHAVLTRQTLHPSIEENEIVPIMQRDLATLLVTLGDYSQAEHLSQTALMTSIEHYGHEASIEVARSQENLANTLLSRGDYAKAKDLYEKALATMITHYSTEANIEVAGLQQNLAVALMKLGDYSQAERLCLTALVTMIDHYGTETHIDVAGIQQNLAGILLSLGDLVQAENLYRTALTTMITHYGTETNLDVAGLQQNLAIILKKLNRLNEAKELYSCALTTQIVHYGTEANVNVAETQQNLALLLGELGDDSQAEKLLRAALATMMTHYRTESHVVVAIAQYNLAIALMNLKNKEALSLIERAEYTFQTQAGGAQHIEACSRLKEKIKISMQSESTNESDLNFHHFYRPNDRRFRHDPAITSQLVATLSGHTAYISALVVLSNGQLASSSSHDKTIRLWEVLSGAPHCVAILEGHMDCVLTLTALPDGQLVSGSLDKTIRLWRISDGLPNCGVVTLEVNDRVTALATLQNGQLVSGYFDGTISLWSPTRCLSTFKGHSTIIFVLIALPNGKLASGSGDNTIRLWKVSDGSPHCLATLEGHTSSVVALVALPNGKLASGSGDKTIRLWELFDESPRCIAIYRGHTSNWIKAMSIIDDHVVSGSRDDATIHVWNCFTGTFQQTLKTSSSIHSCVILSNGNLAVGLENGSIDILDLGYRSILTAPGSTESRVHEVISLSSHPNSLCSSQAIAQEEEQINATWRDVESRSASPTPTCCWIS